MHRLAAFAVATALASSVAAAPASAPVFKPTVGGIMMSLVPQNALASATIRDVYRDYLDLLVIDGYPDLAQALGNGGLVQLPPDSLRFNVRPRVAGLHPIGEKDLENQASYIAARPATIGCLLEIASRVRSGPVEVTSLVRHSEYQDVLRGTNPNATTTVPMHTMGLAFDIALINTPIETVTEILDVLTAMRDAGDILFIGERHQLVFHVVPQPTRLGHFTEVYARTVADPTVLRGAHPIPLVPMRPPTAVSAALVSAEVIDVRPTERDAAAWWAAVAPEGVDGSVSATLVAANRVPREPERPATPRQLQLAGLALLAGLLAAVWRISHPRALSARVHRYSFGWALACLALAPWPAAAAQIDLSRVTYTFAAVEPGQTPPADPKSDPPAEQPPAPLSTAAPPPVDASGKEIHPTPPATGFAALVKTTGEDFLAFPKRRSTWVILAAGGALALAAYPKDTEVNSHLVGPRSVGLFFAPGKFLGAAYTQVAVSVGLYGVGRYLLPKKDAGPPTNRVSHIGFDLLRAQILSQAMVHAMKYTIRRNRPTGECCAFPSGHSATAFAVAAVLERHLGYRFAWPTVLGAAYVAASRLHDNRHYISDVLFGAGIGTATGWTIVGRHGRSSYALMPAPVRGGFAMMVTRVPSTP